MKDILRQEKGRHDKYVNDVVIQWSSTIHYKMVQIQRIYNESNV